MLARLLKIPGSKKVIYLDPDIVAFSRLDDIIDALDSSNILLTPHQTSPERTLAAVLDNEICSLKHGVYNLGFVGVCSLQRSGTNSRVGGASASTTFAVQTFPMSYIFDQRWIDLVPAFFSGVAIMRSGRHNVATWNLTTEGIQFF